MNRTIGNGAFDGGKQALRGLTRGERATVEPARLRQGPVMGLVRPIADADGRIGAPLVALSTLAAMEKHGSITPRQRQAGDEFHRVFRLAALDALKAADLTRVMATGGRGASGVSGHERARRRIAAAMTRLGGEASVIASCAWHVLGLEWSLRQWAEKALRGQHLQAGGVLIGALALIERDFGG